MQVHSAQPQMSIKQYRKMKLRMLKDFGIRLSDEQMNRMNKLETEIKIDNFCISLIRNQY
jgi:5-enolpyruvylshikimate-3-phosphate synthase